MPMFKDASGVPEVTDGGMVRGYASTWDREPDCYGDVVAKGAFSDTLKAWEAKGEGVSIPLLFGHNTDDPEYNIGCVTSAVEDERGLLVEAKFDPDNPKAQYVRKLVREGRLYQFSFAYDLLDQCEIELEDGRKANELRKLDLFEVSLVQIPANQHAEVVDVKGAKYGRRNSKSDEDAIREAISLLEGVLANEQEDESGDSGKAEGGEADAKGREAFELDLDTYKQAVIKSLEVI